MDTTSNPTPLEIIRCRVATHALVRATAEMLSQWRRQPPPLTGQPLPASFLKHSDDQTVACVAAVHRAILDAGWSGRSFAEWGVVAAPNFFGRGAMASSVQRYAEEGAWGVSPHVIPHQSLHAVSGTVSQLLKMHGPNFGISGGPDGSADGLLIAGTLLAEGTLPGLWLILSGHDREGVPVENGKVGTPPPPLLCEAVALALVPAADSDDGPVLRFGPIATEPVSQAFERDLRSRQPGKADLPQLTLASFIGALTTAGGLFGGPWQIPGLSACALDIVGPCEGSRC